MKELEFINIKNRAISTLRYLNDCMLQVVYPSKEDCLICHSVLLDSNWLCNNCVNKIKFCQHSFTLDKKGTHFEYYSLAYYSNIISELILRLKYKSDFDACYALADMMSELIQKNNINLDLITYVPATRESFKKRGYNQSELLACRIGRNLKVSVKSCLVKIKDTKDQIGLNEEMRWENILGSYKLKKNLSLKKKKILLIDDVFTTGATTFCCARELKKAEAESLTILTAAKSKL